MTKRKLVFFERWADPIAEEVLSKKSWIELVRLRYDDPPEVVWAALESAHGYQWPRAPYLGTRELIARCPNLLAMSAQGAGYDMIDPVACTEAGVLVVNQTGLGREAVAEHVVAMIIAVAKQMIQSDRALRRDRKWERLQYTGDEIFGKTIGIIGYGNIGTRLGEICRIAFGMKVLAFDPYLAAEEIARRGAAKVDLETLLASSDYVSVNCPLTPETRNMFGAERFGKMKRGAIFVTAARGGIHDEAALAEFLRNGHLTGAGLDVWSEEPPPLTHPLLNFDNVILTPHNAGVTKQAYRALAEGAALQWIEILSGGRPPRLQNPEVWPRYQQRFHAITGESLAA
jgi:D-3-phosphoglycerate dehydrogenase / 2-oxoglutarate reductase